VSLLKFRLYFGWAENRLVENRHAEKEERMMTRVEL
jgi:hypothetical protein